MKLFYEGYHPINPIGMKLFYEMKSTIKSHRDDIILRKKIDNHLHTRLRMFLKDLNTPL